MTVITASEKLYILRQYEENARQRARLATVPALREAWLKTADIFSGIAMDIGAREREKGRDTEND